MVDLLGLAVALAIDATAANAGMAASGAGRARVAVAALVFGGFQAGMAALGWLGGAAVVAVAEAWDHWVAAALLTAVGAQMIRGSFEERTNEAEPGAGRVIALAFATSLDALASGVSLPLLPVAVPVALGAIGAVTSVLSLLGGMLGQAVGDRLGGRVQAFAGLVVIGIGARVVMLHTW